MSWPSATVWNPELYVTDDLITPPAIEPIDLDEVKKHIRFTPTSEDTLIDTYIAMARQYFEQETGRTLIDTLYERRMEHINGIVELAHPPLLEVVSITYPDSDGNDAVMDPVEYVVDAPTGSHARRGLVCVAAGASWPSVTAAIGAVRIRYRAGYGSHPGDVPELVKGCLYFLVGHFHQFRSEGHQPTNGSGSIQELPLGAQAMLRSFKYTALPTRPPLRAL